MTLAENDEFTPVKVQDYISENWANPNNGLWDELEGLARLTALRRDRHGSFFISNPWRGPMLYSLVRRLEPRVILELGTGRGYGAFSMAKALHDGEIDGKLFTVDRTPPSKPMLWPYVNQDQENVIENVSLDEFWNEHLPARLIERIDIRTGDTASVHDLLADQAGQVDLVFIDSDHTYNGVALDFLSAHSIAKSNAVFVFDDYSATSGYGIRRLLNEELSGYYAIQVIDMELTAAHDISVDHMMAVVNGGAVHVDTPFSAPSSLRFRRLLAKRWVRNRLISVKRKIK